MTDRTPSPRAGDIRSNAATSTSVAGRVLGLRAAAMLEKIGRRPGAAMPQIGGASGGLWTVTGPRVEISLLADPTAIVELNLDVLADDGVTWLYARESTDGLVVSRPSQYLLALEVEDDIVAMLTDVAAGRVRLGVVKGRPAMILAHGDGYLCCRKGRWAHTAGGYPDLASAMARGTGWRTLDLF